MFKVLRSLIVLMLLVSLLPASLVMAQSTGAAAPALLPPGVPDTCTPGVDANGSQTLICTPTVPPNPLAPPTLVIYAHGYVWPFLPEKQIPWDQMFIPDPTVQPTPPPVFVGNLVTDRGYYFATTSYRANGLVVQDAIDDLLLVRDIALARIYSDYGQMVPVVVILAGVSEGGLITTLSVERHPEMYMGGLAMCGPIGDFRKEIDYWGNFRSLFDVYYPDIKDYPPGSTTISIPNELISAWLYDTGLFRTQLMAKVVAPDNLARTQDLLYMGKISVETTNNPLFPYEAYDAILNLLNYNIFATMNGQMVLDGNPFDNRMTVYLGSAIFPNLNGKVANYKASYTALQNLAPYQTTGQLVRPLVVLHTTGDAVVPYWHATLYQAKENPPALFKLDTVERYGHCSFTPGEVVGAFDDLGMMILSQLP